MWTLAKSCCEISATLTSLIGCKRIVGDSKWKVQFKANVLQRRGVTVHHYSELASWGVLILGGADIFQQQSLKSVDAARPSAPPALVEPNNRTCRPNATYPGGVRASVACEAAEWCWPSISRCHFVLFCVLKCNSGKESESDQLFCAQATLRRAQLINMQSQMLSGVISVLQNVGSG